MVVIRGRFYARPFDSDRSISPIYCTISRTKDLRVHLSPCTPAQSARPWTVSVAFRILIADEMNFAPKKIFFSAKMLLFSKNSGLIVASITGASKRGFKRFVPRISTVYPAWFRYLPFQKRENLRCGRKDRKESSGRVQSMDGQRDPESIFDRFARKITSSRTESLQFRLTGSVS